MTFAPACGLFEPEHPTITVVKGDTLSKLARANGVTVAQLKEWNELSSDTIEIGQVLVLKVDSPADAGQRRRAHTQPNAPAPSEGPHRARR
jgi:LysM repeat protein